MGTITLEELKKLNAENEAKETEAESEEVEENEELEGEKPESESIETEEISEETEAEEPEEVEAWQASEDSEDSQDGKTGFVPNAGAKKLRLKAKAYRDERDQAQSELEQLRSELEKLKSGHINPVQTQELKRPKLEDFDYNEEAYNRAMDDYLDKRIELKQSQYSEVSQQTQAIQAQKQAQDEAVNKHYQEAEKLLAKHNIDAQKYADADGLIRSTIESVMPQKGDEIADSLIAKLVNSGEGSEKVWYYLGRNAGALSELKNSLSADPTGLQTMLMLGRLSAKATAPVRVKSDAPPAPKQLKGDASVTASSLHRKYKKTGDVTERLKIKREAKKAGEDVSKW